MAVVSATQRNNEKHSSRPGGVPVMKINTGELSRARLRILFARLVAPSTLRLSKINDRKLPPEVGTFVRPVRFPRYLGSGSLTPLAN